jgi:hypothetical protein
LPEPFFLIVAVTRDSFASKADERSIECGPTGPDRDALATEHHRDHKLAGVPPGSDPVPASMTARLPIILNTNTRITSPHPPDTVPALIAAAGSAPRSGFLTFFAPTSAIRTRGERAPAP